MADGSTVPLPGTLARFDQDVDDVLMLTAAEDFTIASAADYEQAWALEKGFADLETRITNHYAGTKRNLNALVESFRSMVNADLNPVKEIRASLRRKIGAWKDAQDRAYRQRALDEQATANEAAAKRRRDEAAAMTRLAAAEPDPVVAASFAAAATAHEHTPDTSPPVDVAPSVPKIANAGFRTEWTAHIDDLRALIAAWLDPVRRVPLDEDDMIAGLQRYLDEQANALQDKIGQSFPGVSASSKSIPVSRGRRS